MLGSVLDWLVLRLGKQSIYGNSKSQNVNVVSFAIGIVGDAGVRGTAQQPRLFVGMILILIFAEVLGWCFPELCNMHY